MLETGKVLVHQRAWQLGNFSPPIGNSGKGCEKIGKENFKKIAEKNYRLGIWIKAEDKEGFNGYKEQVRKLTEQNFKKES